MWRSSSQSRTFVTPSVLCSQLSYVTRNRHMWKYELFFKQWSCFDPQAALWGHSDNTSLLKRDFSDFIWLVVGRWQNDRRFIDNSSHEKWVFSTVPLLSLPPVLFLSQMMRPCGLEDCRDVKPAGCFRSPTNFCLSEKTAAVLVTLQRGKSGVCKSHGSKAPLLWCTVEFHRNPPPKYLLLQRHDSDFPLLSAASLIYALQSSC